VFAIDKHFQLSLMFAGKAKSLT